MGLQQKEGAGSDPREGGNNTHCWLFHRLPVVGISRDSGYPQVTFLLPWEGGELQGLPVATGAVPVPWVWAHRACPYLEQPGPRPRHVGSD